MLCLLVSQNVFQVQVWQHAIGCARAIRKSKSLKTGGVGALLEVQLRKICTTPARESDSEVKIVKN